MLLIFGANRSQAESLSSQFVAKRKDFFQIYSPHETDLELRYIYQPKNEEDGGRGEYDLGDFVGSFEIPMLLSSDTFLRLRAEYEARLYDFKPVNFASTSASSENLHKATVGFGFGHFISNNLFATALVSSGIYSDFDNTVDVDDIRIYGDAILVYRINPGTQFLLGVELSETFDDVPIFPIVGFRATSEDGRLHLSLTAPIEARIAWNFDPRAQVFGLFKIGGDVYDARLGPDDVEVDIQVHDRRFGGGILYWLGNRVNLVLEGGLSISSEFEFKTSANAGQFRGEMNPAPYLALGFGFSL